MSRGGVRGPDPKELFAAVDLGSNSFHMIVARLFAGKFHVVDRRRERVRIAGGLDARGHLDADSQERALECLQRFGETVAHIPSEQLRAVGTNTFRRARNARQFLRRAEKVLGHPIDVISGQEEGRLVYLGVAHHAPPTPGLRLVIDIGGGSTECVLGEGTESLLTESVWVGCVDYSLRYFPEGVVTREAFREASLAVRRELQGLAKVLRSSDVASCLGSSGTVHAVQRILSGSGWASGGITYDGLRQLRKDLVTAGNVHALELPELRSDRRPVLPGGLAILMAVFKSFDLTRMEAAPGGLREGLLYDLQGRIHDEDVRDRTIRSFSSRFYLDQDQAERVRATALDLLSQTAGPWKLEGAYPRQLLGWAALLHEIGLGISHIGYHKHGEYLLSNSNLPGFSTDDQNALALLVRCHRRKLPLALLDGLPHLKPKTAIRLCLLLRLAVLFHRSRGAHEIPPIRLEARKGDVGLELPPGWLDEHPLTRADLDQEALLLEPTGHRLVIG